MDFYSTTLSLALATAIAALGITVISWFKPRPGGRLNRLALGAAVVSLFVLCICFLYHLFVGHRPGTPQELAPLAFVREHPALLVAGAVAMIAIAAPRKR
ncbi:MAG: hypothetical protein R3344_03140 [Acidobacteriota bacterium]|nr:hypothetical protein [Acidobacteriota bacterium]